MTIEPDRVRPRLADTAIWMAEPRSTDTFLRAIHAAAPEAPPSSPQQVAACLAGGKPIAGKPPYAITHALQQAKSHRAGWVAFSDHPYDRRNWFVLAARGAGRLIGCVELAGGQAKPALDAAMRSLREVQHTASFHRSEDGRQKAEAKIVPEFIRLFHDPAEIAGALAIGHLMQKEAGKPPLF